MHASVHDNLVVSFAGSGTCKYPATDTAVGKMPLWVSSLALAAIVLFIVLVCLERCESSGTAWACVRAYAVNSILYDSCYQVLVSFIVIFKKFVPYDETMHADIFWLSPGNCPCTSRWTEDFNISAPAIVLACLDYSEAHLLCPDILIPTNNCTEDLVQWNVEVQPTVCKSACKGGHRLKLRCRKPALYSATPLCFISTGSTALDCIRLHT
jgi:hypothetical protein